MLNPTDLTEDELEELTRTAATQMPAILTVTVLRLIAEVRRRRLKERG
jgi:hypothetical protein